MTCSNSQDFESETMSTLRFATHAKFIKSTPRINREKTYKELKLLLSKALREI